MSQYTKTTNFASKDNLSPGNPLKIVKGAEIDTEFNNIQTAVATKTDNSNANITGGSITGITDLAIADGGTGASTATAALNNLLPSQTGNATKYLQTDGSNATWDAVSLSTSDITGTLPVANGGTGVTSSTGTGSVVLSNSPTLVTPALGTPASATLTNATGLPISTGVSGLGSGVATFLATPSSANLASAVSDETGSGALVFANSPTLVTPALGTPSSGTLTNATGLPISTGVSGLGTGVATFLATPSSANLISAVTDETGTGSLVFATSPTLVTPALGTPSSATLTNATGLPIATGVSGLGTGVATALAVNVGSAGAPVVNGGALGTPSSGTATNLTGLPLSTGVTGTLPVANGGTGQTSYTNGQLLIGNTTGNTLTKATLTAGSGISITNGGGSITIAASGGGGSGDVTGPASSTDNALARFDSTTGKIIQNSVGILSDTGAISGLTDISASGSVTLSGGTANGVTYLNGSKVLTSGSALTFDGTNVGIGTSTPQTILNGFSSSARGIAIENAYPLIAFSDTANASYKAYVGIDSGELYLWNAFNGPTVFAVNNAEQMRLTSTGLGIGTSSPAYKLDINGTIAVPNLFDNSGSVRFKYSAANAASRDWRIVSDIANYGDFGIQQSTTQGGSTFDTKLVFSSSGNLGLGVTPSASTYGKAFEIGSAGNEILSAANDFYVSTNAYYNSGWKYGTSTFASQYNQTAGSHRWYTAASGTAGNAITFTQAMTLDASGNLLVGITSSGWTASNRNIIHVAGTSSSLIGIGSNSSTGTYLYTDNTDAILSNNATGSLRFNTAGTERARIDSSGNLLVGTTSGYSGERMTVAYNGSTQRGIVVRDTASQNSNPMAFIYGSTLVGYIGITSSSTSYNTSSDYRLKNTVAPMTGALAKVALLKPCTYKWNTDGSDGEGFIAHELAEVVPQCVTGEKDAVDAEGNPQYQGIDTSFLVATLTAALQELNAKFDAYVASHP